MTVTHFDRSALPPAWSFYERELGELRRPDRKGWARPKSGCPFHHSESGTSFHVNVNTGAFFCFGCSAKGGDVLAFVRLRYKLSFAAAAKELGAWRDNVTPEQGRNLRRLQAERERQNADRATQAERQRQERIGARNELHRLERDYSEANARLTRLRRGAPDRYRGEQNLAWWFLSDTLPRIRQAESDYLRLAGLEGHVI